MQLGWTVVLALAALGGAAATPVENAMRVVTEGTQSAIRQPRRVVVRTEDEWKKLWTEHTQRVDPKPALPAVDWSKEMLLAVFMGERSTGGYRIAVKEAREADGKLVVTVTEQSPGFGGATIQVLTAPYQMVAVKRSSLPVDWKRQAVNPPGFRPRQ